MKWRVLDNFRQALETSKSSIFQAEIITLGRVVVTPSPVMNVMDTQSSFSTFSSAKVATLRVGWSLPWKGAVGRRSRLGTIWKSDACHEDGIEITECPDSWSVLLEKCLWHCPFTAAAVCWGCCRLCDKLSVGCSAWESDNIKHYREKHQSGCSQFRWLFLLPSFLPLMDQFCFSSLFLKLLGATLKTVVQMSMF